MSTGAPLMARLAATSAARGTRVRNMPPRRPITERRLLMNVRPWMKRPPASVSKRRRSANAFG